MRFSLYMTTFAVALLSAGCQNETSNSTQDAKANTESHSHEHGADGSHEHTEASTTKTTTAAAGKSDAATCNCEHGPYGGHLLRFENKDFLADWLTSKDNDVVRFYLLNADQKDVPMKVDSFTVTPMAGSDATPFELKAESPGTDGKAFIFSADSKDLRASMNLGVKVLVKSGDLVLTGIVDAHEPHDH